MTVPRFAQLGIHFPLVKPPTMSRWHQCLDTVNVRAGVLEEAGLVTFLCSDHNDRSGKLFIPEGFERIGGSGALDYIGVRVPALPGRQRPRVKVLDHALADGTIDGHNFPGVRVQLTWPGDFVAAPIWIVQANLGRGEPAAEFVANVGRIKAGFRGRAVYNFDEIDEADRPAEHELLGEQFPRVDGSEIVGWGTMNPTVVRGRGLAVVRPRITHACDGLARFTPARTLVESVITISAAA